MRRRLSQGVILPYDDCERLSKQTHVGLRTAGIENQWLDGWNIKHNCSWAQSLTEFYLERKIRDKNIFECQTCLIFFISVSQFADVSPVTFDTLWKQVT